ncbi:hypothetical protein V8C42DRAFT_351309 [Trichoderma barbatum]
MSTIFRHLLALALYDHWLTIFILATMLKHARLESPLSDCHSRLSSVASVSGVSSSSIPVVEMPLFYARRFEARSPQLDLDITAQSPSPPLTEEGSAAKQDRPSITGYLKTGPLDATPNLRKLEHPVVFWGGLRSELTARPKYHKRATSAPLLASRTTTPVSDTLNDLMGKSTAKGLPAQAEEPELSMAASYQEFDPERRVLHHALRNGHANAVVDRLPACGAIFQTQEPVPDQAPNIAPLAQLARDEARDASLEALNPALMAPLEEEPRCMFVDDCQTGSQLRKAISHLFGRNKACTLRIPKQVWVYYCRKHYQRIRYRNAKTYPLNQMYLVKMQINRLQRWSEENRRQGAGPCIKLWTLALRKREQSRLDKEAGAADEGDDEALETPNGSAAPDWIIQRLGTGYTTEQMLEVADRLYLEIENGTLCQVPEVEFLPDITEPEVANIAKLVKSRKQARAAAATVDAKASKRRISESAGVIGQMNSSLPIQPDGIESMSPSRKRVRLSPLGVDYHQNALQMPLPSITMPHYANNHVLAPWTGHQSAVPRTLPAVPRMQVPSPSHSQGPVAHIYGLSSNEFRRHSGLDAFYIHDRQQHPDNYRAGTESLLQRNRDHQSQQRLPSISDHLAGASDFQNSTMAIPLYRGSWAPVNEDLNMPRAPRLRSNSDNIPTSQPVLEYPRPSSSGTPQFALTYFDNRATTPSINEFNTRSFSREQWPESAHGYAPGWPQRSGAQQQNHYYDQVTRPQLESLRAPAYFGPTRPRAPAERAGQEAQHLSPCLALRLELLLLLLPLVGHRQALAHEQSAQAQALDGRMHGQGTEIPPLVAVLVREEGVFDGGEAAVKGEGGVEVDVGGQEFVLEGDECAHYGGDPGDWEGVSFDTSVW